MCEEKTKKTVTIFIDDETISLEEFIAGDVEYDEEGNPVDPGDSLV